MYDCLSPWTVGGAERWYRQLAEHLAGEGHEVTYLTRRQWPAEDPPQIPGVRVEPVAPGGELYTEGGRRRIGPPLWFGVGVLVHLARRRQRYDVVHTCSFPYFSMLACRAALAGTTTVIGVDWFEVWSRPYWREYLGPFAGALGAAIQRLCARLSPVSFTYSQLATARLRDAGVRKAPHRLTGLFGGITVEPTLEAPAVPMVVYAGRHIPEKRVPVIPAAIAVGRVQLPTLVATVFGDGPDRRRVAAEVRRLGLEASVLLPGFVDRATLDDALRRAACLLLPSSREGYGLTQIEAAALGTPAVIVAGEDNAATELIEEGVNGFVAGSTDPGEIAAAVLAAHRGGAALRASTAAWYDDNRDRLSAAGSAAAIIEVYEAVTARRGSPSRA